MTVAIAFVRHGHYEQPAGVPSAWLPHPLTEQGEAQSRAGAVALIEEARKRGWQLHPVVDASPLLRAWQTARHWQGELSRAGVDGASIETCAALCERGLGAAANLTVDQIERVIARDPRFEPLPTGWKRQRDFRLPLPGAESLADAGARVAAHVLSRCAELERVGGDGVLVKVVIGHGGSIRNAAADLGILSLDDVVRLSMHYGEPVVYSRWGGDWRWDFGRWKVRDAAHVADVD